MQTIHHHHHHHYHHQMKSNAPTHAVPCNAAITHPETANPFMTSRVTDRLAPPFVFFQPFSLFLPSFVAMSLATF
jgi:hypothetical protein